MMKIVITGGTYAGKTSLIELFKKEGVLVIPDVGLEVIEELNEQLGVDKQKEYRAKNPIEFYTKIIKRQLELESEIDGADVVILDRGVFDYIAMLSSTNVDVPQSIIELTRNHTYNKAFVCDTLLSFSQREESGRSLNKEASLRLKVLVEEVYKSSGCEVISVKEMPIKERFEYVMKHIKTANN